MKRFLLCAAALLFCGALSPARAQDFQELRRNELTFSPVHFCDGTFKLGYQRNFRNTALEISPSVVMKNRGGSDNNGLTGWALEGGYKFFFKEFPRTFMMYVGPWAYYKNVTERGVRGSFVTEDNEYYFQDGLNPRYNILGLGVYFGMHWTWGRFVMDLNVGGGMRTCEVNNCPVNWEFMNDEIFDIGYKGLLPRGNFSVGILF